MNQLDHPKRLLAAARVILKPLVRLLLHYQVSYPALMQVIKSLYVEIAENEMPIDGKRQTESRLSLLTGIHRREVKRLRGHQQQTNAVPDSVSLGGQLVAQWLTREGYQQAGAPLPIPRQSEAPGDVSFETLVETVGHQDIRPRAVLDEWLRLGIVHLDEQDRVALVDTAFIPNKGLEEKLYYWQRNIADHISTASENLDDSHLPRLERSVYYNRLSAEAVAELHNTYRQLSSEVLQTLNQKALTLKQSSPGEYRMNAGVYYHSNAPRAEAERNTSGEHG